jgi:acetylornithine deacetylase
VPFVAGPKRGPFAEHFNVPWTTLQTGTISGGVAVNTVPSDCEFTFEFRNLPGTPANAIFDEIHDHITERLRPEMRARTGHGDVILTRLAAAPAFEADEASPFVQLFRTMTGDAELRKVAYGTEAGLFSEAGIPTVVCGPGDIAQAHKADEFVSLSQLARCEGVLNTLIDEMCAASPPKAALPQKTRTTAKVRL